MAIMMMARAATARRRRRKGIDHTPNRRGAWRQPKPLLYKLEFFLVLVHLFVGVMALSWCRGCGWRCQAMRTARSHPSSSLEIRVHPGSNKQAKHLTRTSFSQHKHRNGVACSPKQHRCLVVRCS